MGLVLIGIVLALFVGPNLWEDDSESPPPLLDGDLTYEELSPAPYFGLAKRFQPLIFFDSAERWRPLAVEPFLDESIHKLCPRDGPCVQVDRYREFRSFVSTPRFADANLRINGDDDASPIGAFEAPAGSCEGEPADELAECIDSPSNLYYHVSRAGDLLLFDYWWYYRFNDSDTAFFDHQSDWEGVVVAVDESDTSTFEWVGFAAHEGVWRYPRDSLSCDGVRRSGTCGSVFSRFGQRVNVYVADGSHASYPYPCERRLLRLAVCVQNESVPISGRPSRFRIPERGFDGAEEWPRNDADGSLVAMSRQPWVRWPGLWAEGSNIRSPGNQARYLRPATGRATDCPEGRCDPVVAGYGAACGGWFGPQAAVTVCNPGRLRSTGGAPTYSLELETGAAPTPSVEPGGSVGTSPGVAQLPGAYLQPGDAVGVEGLAAEGTELFVRARSENELIEGRFPDIGLESGGRAVLSVEERGGEPSLSLRTPQGEILRPHVIRLT
jgi:hypothetical protein